MNTPQSATKIPADIFPVYDELRIQITWMHGRWHAYRELFAHGPERIEMLNAAAGTFFYLVQDAFLSDVQVMLSKLTDPAKTQGHENLSLWQLQQRLEKHAAPHLAAECLQVLNSLDKQCSAFRVWRNKKLAHLDLRTSLKTSQKALPDVSRQMVEDALMSVRNYMNAIDLHFNNSQWGYEHFEPTNCAHALLAAVRDGLRYEELVQSRRIAIDDWRRGKWAGFK